MNNVFCKRAKLGAWAVLSLFFGSTLAMAQMKRSEPNLVYIEPDLAGNAYSQAEITSAYNNAKNNGTIHMKCGEWPLSPNIIMFPWGPPVEKGPNNQNKTVTWIDECGINYKLDTSGAGILQSPFVDSNLFIHNRGGGHWLQRVDYTGVTVSSLLNVSFDNFSSEGSGFLWPGGVEPDRITAHFTAVNHKKNLGGNLTKGSLVALKSEVDSFGEHPWVSQDQGIKVSANKFGISSTWGFAFEVNDFSGFSPDSTGGFTQTNEIDQFGNGRDIADSRFNPSKAGRRLLYFHSWKHKLPNAPYKINTKYNEGDLVVAENNRIMVAQNTGITGAFPPQWLDKEGAIVSDNTLKWKVGAKYDDETVGDAIWFNKDPGDDSAYETVIAGNVNLHNAFIDTTMVRSLEPNSAILRMAPYQVIDFSGLTTEQSKNKHTLGYSSISSTNSLVYTVDNTLTLLAIHDPNNTYKNGYIETPADIITRGSLLAVKGVRLPNMSKQNILALKSPPEGLVVNNQDDHVPVVYEKGKWYSFQLTPLR